MGHRVTPRHGPGRGASHSLASPALCHRTPAPQRRAIPRRARGPSPVRPGLPQHRVQHLPHLRRADGPSRQLPEISCRQWYRDRDPLSGTDPPPGGGGASGPRSRRVPGDRAAGGSDPHAPHQPIPLDLGHQLYFRDGPGVFCMTYPAFLEADEQALAQRFIDDGFVTAPADDRAGLDRIQRRAAELAADYLKLPDGNDPYAMLDTIHTRVSMEDLNGLRLHRLHGPNPQPSFGP